MIAYSLRNELRNNRFNQQQKIDDWMKYVPQGDGNLQSCRRYDASYHVRIVVMCVVIVLMICF